MLRFIHFLLENRIDFVKDMYAKKGVNISHDPEGPHKDPSAIVDHFAQNADPSQRKVHTQWIMNKYNRGDFKQADHPRIRQALSMFDQYKPRLERKDINQYNSLGDLETAVAGLSGPASNKQAKKEAKETGAELVHNQDGVTVHHIKTKEASCQYGAGTKWCTAASDRNMFDTYNKAGPLYVIQHKGRKFQFHIPAENDSPYAHIPMLADEKDDQIQMADVPEHIRKSLAKSTHPAIQHANLIFGNDKMSSDTIDALSKSADAEVKMTALAHPALSKERMDEVVNGDSRSIDVKSLLNNPSLTANHLSRIYGNRETSLLMKQKIVQHPNVSDDIINEVVRGDNGHLQNAATRNPNLKPEHISKLLKSPYSDIRKEAVAHPNATPEHIKYAINNDKHPMVRSAAAYNLNIDDNTLIKAAMDPQWNVRESARYNGKFGPKHIDKMIDKVRISNGKADPVDIEAVTDALNEKKATPENFSKAIKIPELAYYISGHVERTKDHLDQIMNMPTETHAAAKVEVITSNRATKEHYAKALADKTDLGLKETAAMATPHEDQITQALQHPEESVRHAAALNRNATVYHAKQMMKDSNELIARIGKRKYDQYVSEFGEPD